MTTIKLDPDQMLGDAMIPILTIIGEPSAFIRNTRGFAMIDGVPHLPLREYKKHFPNSYKVQFEEADEATRERRYQQLTTLLGQMPPMTDTTAIGPWKFEITEPWTVEEIDGFDRFVMRVPWYQRRLTRILLIILGLAAIGLGAMWIMTQFNLPV